MQTGPQWLHAECIQMSASAEKVTCSPRHAVCLSVRLIPWLPPANDANIPVCQKKLNKEEQETENVTPSLSPCLSLFPSFTHTLSLHRSLTLFLSLPLSLPTPLSLTPPLFLSAPPPSLAGN